MKDKKRVRKLKIRKFRTGSSKEKPDQKVTREAQEKKRLEYNEET